MIFELIVMSHLVNQNYLHIVGAMSWNKIITIRVKYRMTSHDVTLSASHSVSLKSLHICSGLRI
jgi:hypothetical protein